MATPDEDQPIDGAEEGVSAGETASDVMTPEEARAAGYAPGPEASPDQMTPEEARAAGYVPAHEADPSVMTPEEAKAAGYVPDVESSGAGAFVRSAARGAITTVASLPEIGAGAAIGTATMGPGIGTAVGALGGAIVGGYLTNDALNSILQVLGLRKGTGFASEAQEQADITQHPYLSTAGSVAGGGAAFGTGPATALQRVTGASIFAGLEGGQELVNSGEFDPGKLAIAAAGGALMTQPRGYAERLMKRGANIFSKVEGPGRPDIKGTPESEAAKDEATVDASPPHTTARGTAMELPPPSVKPEPTEHAGVRSARVYSKENAKEGLATGTFGDIAPELSAALEQHARPGMKPEPAEELPLENAVNREALQTPISDKLPSLEAQHAQDIAPAVDANAQAEALQNVKTKVTADQTAEPLTAEQAAVPERAAAPAKAISYETPAPGREYPHVDPELRGILIKRQVPSPNMVASNRAATQVLIDPRVPPSIDVNGKTLDPAQALAVREIARRRVLDLLSMNQGKEGIPDMPFATQLEAAKEAGLHAEKLWLEQRGYHPERYREILDGLKANAPAVEAPVTATVKQPKFVRRTVEALRAKGMEEAAAAIEKLPVERQIAEASRAAGLLNSRTGQVPAQPLKTPRLTPNGFEIDDLGVTTKTKAEAARKTVAIEAAEKVYNDHPPVEGETKDALRARLLKAITAANTANGGKDPITTYKPADPPKYWHWLREAQRLAKGKMTDAQINKFKANEALLRGGEEDIQAYKANRKGEGEIAMSRRSGEAAIAGAEAEKARQFPGETPHEEAEATTPAEPVKAEDIVPAAKDKNLNISDMSEGKQADILADMAKVTENLVSGADELTGQPKTAKWKAEEAARLEAVAEKTGKLKRAREAATLVKKTASEPITEAPGAVRKVEVTPELRAKYGNQPDAKKLAAKREAELTALERDALDKVAAKTGEPPKDYVEPKEGQLDQSVIPPKDEDVIARFAKDESGKLDFAKIDNIWNAKINPRIRWFTDLIGHQTRERGIKADSIFAQGKSERSRQENLFAKEMDERRVRWTKGSSPEEQIKAQLALEKVKGTVTEADYRLALETEGIPPDQAKWMAKDGPMFRRIMDEAWRAEKALGSTADYVDGYVAHIFKDEAGARDFIQRRINSLGATWFQKERSFELISQAIKAGYELRYSNPIDVLNARMRASLKMQEIVNTLQDLNKIGLAKPSATSNKMEKLSWHPVNAPDRQLWYIAPEISPLWKNAMESVGLRDRNDNIGSAYRGWMDVKNTFIPIKLGVSLFHWVHVVLNVNLAADMAREFTRAAAMPGTLGEKVGAFATAFPKTLKVSMQDALFSLPFDRYGHLGKEGRLAWDTPDAQKSPEQKMVSRLIQEGGGIPHRNEQDLIQDRKRLDEALQQKSIKALPLRAQNIIKKASAWMFEEQIPNLKTASYLRDAAALFQRRPDLINNHMQRGIALRAIMKSVDNRFGEMYYNALFMNRTLKDTAIGSFLSLGWNLGQVREFGGAAANVATGKGRGAASPSQRTIYEAGNKGAYTLAYVATSMLSAGALSYAMSGVVPTDWKDYFFPRVGGNDPEGQPRRLTTPFNTREPIMLKAHIDSEGPIGGITTFLWNKMILSPVVEALHNKDYYGRELYDTQAPWYQKAFQLVDSIMGDNLTPITASSWQRAREQGGGGPKEAILAGAGFGPAPAYVNRSPLQRKLSQMYFSHGVAQSRPYQDRGPVHAVTNYLTGAPPSVAEERSAARAAYNRAAIEGDKAAMAKAKGAMVAKGKMSTTTVGSLQPGDADKRMFARVPIEDKQSLVRQMSPEEFRKLVMTNRPISGKDRAVLMKQWGSQNVKKSPLP
jgi:hypothetical protein